MSLHWAPKMAIMYSLVMGSAETIYVGDAENDVTMAQTANVEPVVVLIGHLTRAKASQLGVNYVIQDITMIDDILQC